MLSFRSAIPIRRKTQKTQRRRPDFCVPLRPLRIVSAFVQVIRFDVAGICNVEAPGNRMIVQSARRHSLTTHSQPSPAPPRAYRPDEPFDHVS